ncbi:MAG: hypothetical protein JSU96_03835, partial [Acidobacteriota bacterium]
MEDVRVRWVLKGGYSQFVTGSRLVVQYKPGPLKVDFDQSPVRLLRGQEPLEIAFRLSRTVTAESPEGLRWKLTPSGRIRALLIPSGGSFLGNHKVPKGHFGVQWTVEGEVNLSAGQARQRRFFQVRTGSRTSWIWVRLFETGGTLESVLQESWKGFVDPCSVAGVLGLPDSSFVTWSWSGSLNLSVALNLTVDRGWEVGRSAIAASLTAALGASAGIHASARVTRRGDFTLRLSRRRGKRELSILRRRQATVAGGLEVGVSLARKVQVKAEQTGIQPLLSPVNRRLKQALARQLEIGLALSASSWKRKRIVLKLSWPDSLVEESGGQLRPVLNSVIKGRIPERTAEVLIEWSVELSKGRQHSIRINVLDWISLGRESTREEHLSVSATPKGDILITRGLSLEKVDYAWDVVQLMRLVETLEDGQEGLGSTEWDLMREGSFSRDQLSAILRAALHAQVLAELKLPPESEFPLDLSLTWVTRFSAEGLAAVRNCSVDTVRAALIRAFQLLEPERYRPGSFWRDWIDFPEVRKTVERNPAQAHLSSIYPVAGRSDVQRRTVVLRYRQIYSYLRMARSWREQKGSVRSLVEPRFEVPVFVLFHLLCPAQLRESV